MQRLLAGEHEQPEIAYNVEAVDDDGFDTADSAGGVLTQSLRIG